MEIILKYFADFTAIQLEQFRLLESLYKEWNEKINVVSRKDIDSLYEKHVLHSLSIAASFEFVDGMEIIDLGTGGGFPGVPLAIFFPEVKFHLVDSIAKKLKVIEAVAQGAGIKNITTQPVSYKPLKLPTNDFGEISGVPVSFKKKKSHHHTMHAHSYIPDTKQKLTKM